jgi:hypothetical protein
MAEDRVDELRGVPQMQFSRLLRGALARMRDVIDADAAAAA